LLQLNNLKDFRCNWT